MSNAIRKPNTTGMAALMAGVLLTAGCKDSGERPKISPDEDRVHIARSAVSQLTSPSPAPGQSPQQEAGSPAQEFAEAKRRLDSFTAPEDATVRDRTDFTSQHGVEVVSLGVDYAMYVRDQYDNRVCSAHTPSGYAQMKALEDNHPDPKTLVIKNMKPRKPNSRERMTETRIIFESDKCSVKQITGEVIGALGLQTDNHVMVNNPVEGQPQDIRLSECNQWFEDTKKVCLGIRSKLKSVK